MGLTFYTKAVLVRLVEIAREEAAEMGIPSKDLPRLKTVHALWERTSVRFNSIYGKQTSGSTMSLYYIRAMKTVKQAVIPVVPEEPDAESSSPSASSDEEDVQTPSRTLSQASASTFEQGSSPNRDRRNGAMLLRSLPATVTYSSQEAEEESSQDEGLDGDNLAAEEVSSQNTA